MNVDWIAKLPAPIRRTLYFNLQGAIGSRIQRVWKEFQEWEKFTPTELNQAVENRLSALLQTATRSSEYYRALKLPRLPHENAKDWLRRFPILTRLQVRENFPRIVLDSLRDEIKSPESVSRKRYDWLVVKTGGSTGAPTTVVHDATARDWGRATRLYAARQCGFPLGTRYFRLWGSEQDLLNQQLSLQPRLLRNILAEIPMNAFKAKSADLKAHWEVMLTHPEVQHLMTYVDAAASLAQFIQEQNLPRRKFKTLMACAGTVTPEFRKILKETFSTEVFDKYGSRECCDMACECSFHNGLHVCVPNAHLEIVDDNGNPCRPGQSGRVLVTMLNNLSFPMIRYEIGDMATWSENERCGCGTNFPLIESLQGRQDDMLLTEDGTWQTSGFVRHFVGVSLNRQLIREWQLEQTGPTHLVFRYIALKEEGLSENLAQLEQSFKLVFGKSATIEIKAVREILPSATGKIRWIINSYRQYRP